jgi:aspartate/methionine/tyrosine aminotransferase
LNRAMAAEKDTSATEMMQPGRFPSNDIISLLDVHRHFNLAESTSQDLMLPELLALADPADLATLKLGYGSSAGLPALRTIIGKIVGIQAESVLTTQGTALGIFLLALELCGPGSEAVVATPCFPPSRDAFIGCGVTVNEVPLDFDRRYAIDLDRFAAALTLRTRLVVVASPQNPTGVRLRDDELIALLNVMKCHAPHARLFVDETYREAVYGDAAVPRSAASIDSRIITGASVSKAHGAPGLRVGWLTVPDPDLRKRLMTAKMNVVICGSTLDETLAAALLGRSDLEILAAWLQTEHPRLEWVRPDGGALCCLRLSREHFDESAVDRFWSLLPGLELQLAAGDWFGEKRRVFRLGFGYLPLDRLELALVALSDALDDTLRHSHRSRRQR